MDDITARELAKRMQCKCGCRSTYGLIRDGDRYRCGTSVITERDELLAACKAVQQWADEQNISIPKRCGLRAALAKATGNE